MLKSTQIIEGQDQMIHVVDNLSFVDIVNKDIHLFQRLQKMPESIKVPPIKIDHFEIKSARPFIQRKVELKNCYYIQGDDGPILDMKMNIEILRSRTDGVYDRTYLECVLKLNDYDLNSTIQHCVFQRAWQFTEKHRIENPKVNEIITFIQYVRLFLNRLS